MSFKAKRRLALLQRPPTVPRQGSIVVGDNLRFRGRCQQTCRETKLGLSGLLLKFERDCIPSDEQTKHFVGLDVEHEAIGLTAHQRPVMRALKFHRGGFAS